MVEPFAVAARIGEEDGEAWGSAQDIALAAPLNVQFLTAFLTGSNRRGDFQNVGFTGDVSVIPEPGTAFLLGSGLLGLAWRRRPRIG